MMRIVVTERPENCIECLFKNNCEFANTEHEHFDDTNCHLTLFSDALEANEYQAELDLSKLY